jgi:hypothetical protein
VNACTIIINIVLLYMFCSTWNRNYVSQGIQRKWLL